MNKPVNFADGLESLTASLGTARDKATSVAYVETYVDDQQLTAAYKTSWLAKKIVDIPATDTFRRWRNWQAEEDQIEKLEALEKKLGLKEKFLRADKLARLYGCCYVYYDMGDDQSLPVDPTKVKLEGIRFATVLTHRQLSPGEIEQDALSDRFGKPKWFDVVGPTAAGVVRIDCSRVIVFLGSDSPDDNLLVGTRQGYGFRLGVSVLSAVIEAVKHFDSVAANIASLVFEAKIDVIKVKGLMQIAGNPHEERKLLARYALASVAKGNNGMLILDGDMEEYEQKAYSFAALPDIMDRFSQNASGAADVPMTRLFGTSPGGMNATGESDLRNYYDHISANQELRVRPALEMFDECLIHSALGSRPPEVHYLWASLWQMSDKERSELGRVGVSTIKTLKDTGLIPDEVLSRGAVNMLTQAGIIPGLEAEYDAYFKEGGEAPWDMAEEGEDGKAEALIPPKKPSAKKVADAQPRDPKGTPTGGQWSANLSSDVQDQEQAAFEIYKRRVTNYFQEFSIEGFPDHPKYKERMKYINASNAYLTPEVVEEQRLRAIEFANEEIELALSSWSYEPKRGVVTDAQTLRALSRYAEPVTSLIPPQSDFVPISDFGTSLSVVLDYKSPLYKRINGNLRSGGQPTKKDLLRDALIAKHTNAEEMILLRGFTPKGVSVTLESTGEKSFRPGMKFKDPGYVSTTRDAGVARSFAGGKGVVLRVKVPKQSNILPVNPTDKPWRTDEFVLPRGSEFEVISYDPLYKILDVEVKTSKN